MIMEKFSSNTRPFPSFNAFRRALRADLMKPTISEKANMPAKAANTRTARVGHMKPSGSRALGAFPDNCPHDIQNISENHSNPDRSVREPVTQKRTNSMKQNTALTAASKYTSDM